MLLAAVLAASIVVSAPAPAFAASKIRVKTTVRTVTRDGAAAKVLFKNRLTKASKVKVTIYKKGKKIRTLRSSGRASKKTVSWNLRDAKGRKVAPGTYTYKVTATTSTRSGTRKGSVKVRPPATEPVPAPVPAPAPAGDSRWVGFYVPGVPTTMDALYNVESQISTQSSVVNFFISDGESFPSGRCNNVRNAGATPLVTLEFWSTQNGGLDAINGGTKDAYLRNFADSAKAYGGEVWLRPFHEMNGNWYPWSGTATGNSPTELISAWRRVHQIFKERGATNVKFVWCVNAGSVPNTTANQIANYWPGDAYVDSVALDGYNWGTSATWSAWQSFGQVFGATYNTVAGLTSKPMFVAETACAPEGGDKAAWIANMFTSISTNYTRIRGVVWFEAQKERDWRVLQNADTITAFRNGVVKGY